MFLAASSNALATVRYVDANSASPTAPYTTWATAARVIQVAVDAAVAGDEIVVTNGTYASGGRAGSRVAVDRNQLTVRSVNGPDVTVINGSGAGRCVYLTNDTVLVGFTLTNGAGGGVYCESASAVLSNCVLVANWSSAGGGAYGGTLNNCTLSGNSANNGGGGVSGGTLNNCTLTGNSAIWGGGGAAWSTLNNCIVHFNSAGMGANSYDGTLNYCCTTPQPAAGVGNISVDPQLASGSHLSLSSPCRGAGSAACTTGTDIDGEHWRIPPSIGCDEYHAGEVTGPLSVGVVADYITVAVGFPVGLRALIEARTSASMWEFGDGLTATNQPYAIHAWTAPGDYTLVLRAFNESYPSGVIATMTVHVVQAVHYVAAGNTNPLPPYTAWATAATSIQDAVDATTVAGASVLVTNGIYTTGGRAVYGTMTNRVALDKPLLLRSVNGPEVTVIRGYQVPGTTNGDGAIRCVYLTNGACLSGFTLTSGATRLGGDPDREINGGGVWCESVAAIVTNCVVAGNSAADWGGGTFQGTLNHCTLTANSTAGSGGGSDGGELNNCTFTGNSAGRWGGGAAEATLNNCTLTGNSAYYGGGGAAEGTLNNCTLARNSADYGGGASPLFMGFCTLNNCVLTGNSARHSGGGANGATLNNCTLTGNSAGESGGGAVSFGWAGHGLNNCIIYFNTAPEGANYAGDGPLNYCCTTPLPTNGVGNIDGDPQLASASHLSVFSPCRGAGSAAYATCTDIDGESWAVPPSIGCDEYHAGVVTGPLTVGITADYTNVALGFPVGLTALIEGRTTASVWAFGDGGIALNRPFVTYAWNAPGDYTVALWAFNESHPEGVSATTTIHVVAQPVQYVAFGSTNPVAPYTSWATAATNIQDAVDSAFANGTILVTNGVYTTGGRAVYGIMTNRVAVDKQVALRSANGPQFTVIQGYQVPGTTNGDGAIRCVYLTNGASLSGFTLTHGATRAIDGSPPYRESSGGGVWCESASAAVSNCVLVGNSATYNGGGAYSGTLNNCSLTGNSAWFGGGASAGSLNNCTLTRNSAQYGGGAEGSTLNHCALNGNSAGYGGGGAQESWLNNCTLTGNRARGTEPSSEGGGARGGCLCNCTLTGNSAAYYGGGASGGWLNNSIVYFNTAAIGANYYQGQYDGPLNYCCTTPLPTNGVGNITNAPLFVDYAGGNLRLQANSPCINAGLNAYAPGPTDLDGLPRIVSGTVDIGAYEFQGAGSVISYAWLQRYGLPADGSADAADPDGDGLNTWQEWRCLTDPTNALSVLRLLSGSSDGTNVTVSWQSVAGVSYFLECSTNLSAIPPFTLLAPNLPGQSGAMTFTDTNAAALAPLFYRVGVP